MSNIFKSGRGGAGVGPSNFLQGGGGGGSNFNFAPKLMPLILEPSFYCFKR